MLRGIYTSCTGMVAEMDRENVTANNLANIDTVGFKRDNCTTVPFAELLLNAYSKRMPQQVGKLGLGVEAVTQVVDFSSGAISQTDNPTDFAIDGDAMFTVQTSKGARYTRAGAFQSDKDGFLVNKDGYKVLGTHGPIRLRGEFSVTEEGQIMQNGKVLDFFQLFSTKDMKKQGDTQYTNDNAVPATKFRILQGAVEHSNVNPVREMVQMINITRSYDANQKALTSHDETLDKLVNELAK
ncbi:MAG TPA: flagellar basal-body rod protein FlgF [Firmicutes bacterium]|jgi:flagellar basal-body rod protein FlgF|nr:flagellar basal-body rod protein FlgF [Bacillota bacterium]